MTLHQLLLFVTVAETRNISIASTRLGVSQPAVTRQLRQLAEEYGTRLYTTTGRGVELSPEGERFLQHARNILSAVGQLKDEFHAAAASSDKELSVGACFPASASVMPSAISTFKKSFPEVRINLTIERTGALLQSVVEGGLDLALVLRLPDASAPLMHDIVSHYTPVLVGPAGHTLTKRSRLAPRDLQGIPLILQKDGSIREKLLIQLKRAGVEPRIEMECVNAEGIKTAIKAGLGFGFLFPEHISTEVQSGLLAPLNLKFLKGISVPCYTVCVSNKRLGGALQAFLGLLSKTGADHALATSPEPRKLPPA